MLRNALYENYIPQSIQNLKYSARLVLIVLIAMTLSSYILSKQKYDQLKENFHNIKASELRMQSIGGIGFSTSVCALVLEERIDR